MKRVGIVKTFIRSRWFSALGLGLAPVFVLALAVLDARMLTDAMPTAAWTGIGVLLWAIWLFTSAFLGWRATSSHRALGACGGACAALFISLVVSWVHGAARLVENSESPGDSEVCTFEPSSDKPPNVVLVLVDTLRRDRLGLYGYGRDTSEHLDAFAQRSMVFENGFAQSPSTKASIASIFTGLFPNQHRAIYNPDSLADDVSTLAEELGERGYRSAAFVENPMIGKEFNYHQGFDRWSEDFSRHTPKKESPKTEAFDAEIQKWLGEAIREESQTPYFLYVHYIDPHSPYSAPKPYSNYYRSGEAGGDVLRVGDQRDKDTAALSDRYDEEIRFIDDRVARILKRVGATESLARDRETVVLFVSDHGEGFKEHGKLHHSYGVYGELIRVPLLVHLPGGACAGRVHRSAQHVDILPTLLRLADGVGFEADIGDSVSAGLLDSSSDSSRAAFGEHLRDGWGMRQSYLIRDGHKLIENIDYGVLELYDVTRDPHDQRNLLLPWEAAAVIAGLPIGALSPAAAIARERLQELRVYQALEVDRVADEADIDEETREALKNLGYVW
ncbi:MAG: sulfatase-like hydrolase/transferase [Myxococcota bacterium]